jgi:hypothetical protein
MVLDMAADALDGLTALAYVHPGAVLVALGAAIAVLVGALDVVRIVRSLGGR